MTPIELQIWMNVYVSAVSGAAVEGNLMHLSHIHQTAAQLADMALRHYCELSDQLMPPKH